MSRVITEKVEITDKTLKPSKRLVDANALEVVGTVIPSGIDEKSYVMGMEYILNKIDSMPTIEERKRGEWLELTNTNHTYVCSVCGRMLVNITDGKNMVTKNYPFCHCGADMRESHCDDCRFYDEECVYCPVKQERREE